MLLMLSLILLFTSGDLKFRLKAKYNRFKGLFNTQVNMNMNMNLFNHNNNSRPTDNYDIVQLNSCGC